MRTAFGSAMVLLLLALGGVSQAQDQASPELPEEQTLRNAGKLYDAERTLSQAATQLRDAQGQLSDPVRQQVQAAVDEVQQAIGEMPDIDREPVEAAASRTEESLAGADGQQVTAAIEGLQQAIHGVRRTVNAGASTGTDNVQDPRASERQGDGPENPSPTGTSP
jgi:hypothetical protein